MIGTKILVSVLALGLVGGGAVGAHTLKSSSALSQEVKKKEEKQDPNEQAKLQQEATITKDQATKTVLQQYDKGTVNQVELEDEDDSAVYSVHFAMKNGKSYDVKVDAKTGKIIKTEDDHEYGKEIEND